MTQNRLLTSHEVATLVQVSPSAVLRWIDLGLLKAFRTPGGHRRISPSALRSFLKEHQMPVPMQLAGAAPRVLIIDDDPAFSRSLAKVLRQADPDVLVETSESPVAGLLRVGVWRPDVVLLDAYMPGMDGTELCERLKRDPETSTIAVIAMSGRPSPELRARFEGAGAAGFLPKPVTSAALLGALEPLGLVKSRS